MGVEEAVEDGSMLEEVAEEEVDFSYFDEDFEVRYVEDGLIMAKVCSEKSS